MSTLERAIAIAAEAHAGLVDKAGEPYILHPLRVMLRMTSPAARIVAVLHDVVEDGRERGFTLERLRTEGFGEEVLAGVEAVTKRRDEEGRHADPGFDERYMRFVARAAANPLGREVKIADLEDNADLSRIARPSAQDRARVARYERALLLIRSH